LDQADALDVNINYSERKPGSRVRLPVLIVSADAASRQMVEEVSQCWALESVMCANLKEATSLLARQGFGVIFCEGRLPDGDYRDLLAAVRHPARKSRVVVMVSGTEEDASRREAMRVGAFDVIPSPCSKKEVQWVIIRATQDRSMSAPAMPDRRRTSEPA